MESKKKPNVLLHNKDIAIEALESAQVGFMILMRSINPSLRNSIREHVSEIFSLAHLFGKEKANMTSV